MNEIHNRRAIIDRVSLAARLAGLAENHRSDQLNAAVLDVLKEALRDGSDNIRQQFEGGVGGMEAAQSRSFLIDQIIRVLFDFTVSHVYPVTNPTSSERLGIVAVGGYGRGQLAPFSDIDLMFLLPYKQTPWGEQVVEYLLYKLWDMGLNVGHSVRSVDMCVGLAREDWTIRTSLLEARYIWGDDALFREIRERFDHEVVAGSGPAFVEAKLAERDARHVRMGDSRYVVEPNLKEGKGGLRDLHTLFWIAKYLYRARAAPELVKKGVLSVGEARKFAKAEQFLWTVRFRLHYLAGRAEERLTFDVQGELAKSLGYTNHAGSSGVERFMKHYFLTAKDVGDLTRIFCAHLEAEHRRKNPLRVLRPGLRQRMVDGFLVDGERLTVPRPDLFQHKPVEMIRLFLVTQNRNLDIHPAALRLITRNLRKIDDTVRHDPEANRLFLEILTSRKDPELTLRRMNEAGVFGAFIQDFGRVVAQMQHDMYHVYTVDEHTIRAIGILSRIEQGELGADHPLSNEIIHKVLSRRVLYVAVLLHDIAKGRGRDHSAVGAEIAASLCPRLGLTDAETETVSWLVRHHLLMSNVAFKRDIADPKTVADFASRVKSPERLRLLLILTVADIRAVGPTVWNGWKGQLLRDLYYRAEEVLLGGLASGGGAERIEAAKMALRSRLSDWSAEAAEAYEARHFDSYWLSAPAAVQERDARLAKAADSGHELLAIETRVDSFRSVTDLTIYTGDHSGLFASVAGAIAMGGASIVDARIISTKDGMALDSFSIQNRERGAFDQSDGLEALKVTIERVIARELDPERFLARRPRIPARTRVFKVAPRVLIDNKASDGYTVIEVNGRDRPGLLFDLTRALFKSSVTISSAHIATFGEQAVDVFYVRDLFGHKITHPAKLGSIEVGLITALEHSAGENDDRETEPINGKTGRPPVQAQ
ncbi:MAG: [protein-PII] uridylyltransferase [Sphingomonadales bacterium]